MKNNFKKMIQDNIFTFGLVVLLAGFVIGATIAASVAQPVIILDDDEIHQHDHTLPHAHGEHLHEQVDITEDIPTLDLVVLQDSKSGWNLQLITTNFEFDPENANEQHIAGKGHAHLYINGEKITRLYSQWYHIPTLDAGLNTIEVTLNSNDHKDLATGGQTIAASVQVDVD